MSRRRDHGQRPPGAIFAMKAFVTGATGLAGSHLAERLVELGHDVVALVRPTSDTGLLRKLGAQLAIGDLNDQPSIERGMKGADVVFHVAAKVTDWGSWAEFQRDIIDGTRHVLEAMRACGVRRIVYMSSVAVYGYVAHRGGIWNESAPYASHFLAWEHYAPAKIAAEKLALSYHDKNWVEACVIRPGWIYGPRDRASLPRLVQFLKGRMACCIGSGENPVALIYAQNLADACLLAASKPNALGRIFNISTDCQVTQRQYLNALAQGLGLKPVTRSIPLTVALNIARLSEFSARLLQQKEPPTISRYAVYILSNKAVFDCTRARQELGWSPRIGFEEGLAKTIEWFKAEYLNSRR